MQILFFNVLQRHHIIASLCVKIYWISLDFDKLLIIKTKLK